MPQINVALESFCILINLIMLIGCFAKKIPNGRQNALFTAMITVNIATLVCDLLTWQWDGQADRNTALYILHLLVYILGYVLVALFAHFLFDYLPYSKSFKATHSHITIFLCVLGSLLAACSLFNGLFFRYENGIYTRGPWFVFSQIYPMSILAIGTLFVFKNRRLLPYRLIFLISYTFLPIASLVLQLFVQSITILFLSSTVALLILFVAISTEESLRLQQKEAEIQRANMALMLSQIQPHFMCNVLCAIQDLAAEKAPEAARAAGDFSKFLRGNLSSLSASGPIPFEKALEHTRYYLSLEKMRFEDRLNVEYDIETTAFCVPPLTMQPLVENAVRHGICKRRDGGTIRISTREQPNAYVICIADNGVGFDPAEIPAEDRPHIGLPNARDRIQTMCGGTLDIQSTRGGGTTVTITLPKEAAQNAHHRR